jgi:hypothetical protein
MKRMGSVEYSLFSVCLSSSRSRLRLISKYVGFPVSPRIWVSFVWFEK